MSPGQGGGLAVIVKIDYFTTAYNGSCITNSNGFCRVNWQSVSPFNNSLNYSLTTNFDKYLFVNVSGTYYEYNFTATLFGKIVNFNNVGEGSSINLNINDNTSPYNYQIVNLPGPYTNVFYGLKGNTFSGIAFLPSKNLSSDDLGQAFYITESNGVTTFTPISMSKVLVISNSIFLGASNITVPEEANFSVTKLIQIQNSAGQILFNKTCYQNESGLYYAGHYFYCSLGINNSVAGSLPSLLTGMYLRYPNGTGVDKATISFDIIGACPVPGVRC
jgi:hypothetical protein